MDAEYGLSRSSLDMHLDPAPGSAVVHALQPQERLRILGQVGDMLEVESARWEPPVRGFVTASSVVRSSPSAAVFPHVDLAAGIRIPAVPISLPLLSFIGWLQTEAEIAVAAAVVCRSHPARRASLGRECDPPDHRRAAPSMGCLGGGGNG